VGKDPGNLEGNRTQIEVEKIQATRKETDTNEVEKIQASWK